jgi:hypothetical protein
MPRLGLAPSGGGLRATPFHLGVVRFLRDAGLLRNVTHIVSVSGGSILRAMNRDSRAPLAGGTNHELARVGPTTQMALALA